MTEHIVILAARRTPIGAFQGVFAGVTAPQLGAAAARAALADSGVAADAIDEVIFGCVLPAGLGQAPARQAAVGAGIATERARHDRQQDVRLRHEGRDARRADQIRAGSARVILAGGLESMTNAPYLLLEGARRLSHGSRRDLSTTCSTTACRAPGTARPWAASPTSTAAKYGFTRADQDAFAAESVRRAQRAVRGRRLRRRDRARDGQDAQGRAGRRAGRDAVRARHRQDPDPEARVRQGRHGDRGLLVVDFRRRRRHRDRERIGGREPRASSRSRASSRTRATRRRPEWFTTAPAPAIQKALDRAGWKVADVDLFEINEAFACVTMAAMQDLGLDHDQRQRQRRRLRARPPDRRHRRAPHHDAACTRCASAACAAASRRSASAAAKPARSPSRSPTDSHRRPGSHACN